MYLSFYFQIGTSIFATHIGSGHFMGLSGTGASSGIAIGAFEWNTIFMVFVLGWIFIPIYIKARVVTLPEYLRKRFGGFRIQFLLSFMFLIIYTFSKISLEIGYGAMFLKMIWNLNIYQTMLVLLTISGMYTITGGLTAVVYTEILHAGVMILGSILLMFFAFNEVGGYEAMTYKYFHSIPSVISKGNWTAKTECYMPRPDALHIFRDPISGDIPWPGLVFGTTTISLFYGCADQIFIQRCLAGKNMSHIKGGCILCGYLKLLPMFLMVMPGMISRILFPDQVACVVPSECLKYCGSRSSCKAIAYPKLVTAVLPNGFQGLMLTTLCAALMSSLTSIFNSSSALFTMNIYTLMRPRATEKELMVTGRFFVIALLAVTITWIRVIETAHSKNLFEYTQVAKSYLTPPVTAIFLLAIFCKRVNEKGAFWGLILGIAIGVFRLLAELAYGLQTCENNSKCPVLICGMHYLYFSILLLLVSLLSMLGISLITDPIPDKYLHGLCWSLRNSQEERVDLDAGIQWKRFPNLPSQEDKFKEANTCLWKTWDLFCGLEPQPGPKLSPEKATKENMEATKEKIEHGDIAKGTEVLAPGEATRKLEVTKKKMEHGDMSGGTEMLTPESAIRKLEDTKKKAEGTEWGDISEEPFWSRVVNANGIILIILVVLSHIYFF
ncbi:Sodium/glucose cotransporter 1 [Sciurus carolinensis]|uniref:Sodium/glucose cotransporter 2 n=1 Tax=Sciurus carolinensis TaxID=30640 RepID=A0AA41MMD7_SCICA|nr:Sodium/glucose cotransporter 1 [Sciurus carolinensis]